ncbi:YihY/virulence factor BrkB family protein, partial [bacterium]|nr:YihY/virulence factor BrkB family protein [bacterium]
MDRLSQCIATARRALNQGKHAGQQVLKATRTHSAFHFLLLVWQSFVRNRCLVRASSLAYTTLLAMIPVLAVAFSVATNFLAKDGGEGQQQVEQLIEYLVSTV